MDSGGVAPRVRPQRERFLLAHELAHTFFYDRTRDTPRRAFPGGSASEEAFCNAFARALLVPDWVIADGPASPSRVFELASAFDVSAEVAARALADSHPSEPLVALGYEDDGGLHVQWAGWRQGAVDDELVTCLLTSAPPRGRTRHLRARRATDRLRRQVAVVAFAAA
jgi:hypothetical protein